MLRFVFLIIIAIFFFPVLSLGQYVPLDNQYYDRITQKYQEKNRSLISSMKPILVQDIESDSIVDIDSVLYSVPGNSKHKNTFVYRKLFSENLIRYSTKGFSITADPVFNFGLGYDFKESKSAWINTRGLTVTGILGNNLSFNTELYESQAVFASWPSSFISATGVVPGQGKTKPFKEHGEDYFYSNGHLSYSPSNYVNMTMR